MKRLPFLFALGCLMVGTMMSCSTPVSGPDTPPEPSGEPSMVVYECNERLFARSNAFQAIEAYVPELERMQVNVLWLMPIHPRGTKNAVGSPYCIKNHRAIDPAFGTMEDLKSLVNTCHSRHIRVVLDWVANHTAWDHPWVSAHPEWFQEAQTSDEQIWKDVTFLDYSLRAVRDTMTACMLYWMQEAGIDGFRCDYAHGVPTDWWKEAIDAIKKVNPDAFLLAETSKTELFTAGFGLLYSWNYLSGIEKLYGGSSTVRVLANTSNSEFYTTPEGKDRLRYITTHDECSEKAPSSVFVNAQGELSAFCLTIFIGGVPMIYSSQELGYMNKINFFNYNLLPFSSTSATRDALAALMQVYQDTRLLRTGTKQISALDDKVACVKYESGEYTLLVLCNAYNGPKTVNLPVEFQEVAVTDLLTKQKETLSQTLELEAFGYRLLLRKTAAQ